MKEENALERTLAEVLKEAAEASGFPIVGGGVYSGLNIEFIINLEGKTALELAQFFKRLESYEDHYIVVMDIVETAAYIIFH